MNKTSKRGKCTTSNSVLIFNCEDTIFDIERLLKAQNIRLVAVLGRHRSGASTMKGGVEWIGVQLCGIFIWQISSTLRVLGNA